MEREPRGEVDLTALFGAVGRLIEVENMEPPINAPERGQWFTLLMQHRAEVVTEARRLVSGALDASLNPRRRRVGL